MSILESKVYNLESVNDYHLLENDIFEFIFDNVSSTFHDFVFDQVLDHIFIDISEETIEAIFENLPEETNDFLFHQFFNYVEETIERYMNELYINHGYNPSRLKSNTLLSMISNINDNIERYNSESIDALEDVIDRVHESISQYVSHHFDEIVSA